MNIILIPKYEDLFKGPKPTIESLIVDIPSGVIISLMCLINSELIYEVNKKEIQIKILSFISRRFEQKVNIEIFQGIERFSNIANQGKVATEITIFALRYTIEFISREIATYRDFIFVDTTPEQELRIFKAYLLIVGEINEVDRIIISSTNEKSDIDGLKELLWPHAIKQFEFASHSDPIIEGLKSLSFLQFCNSNNILSSNLKLFLLKTGSSTLEDYTGKILRLVNFSLKKSSNIGFDNFHIFKTENNDVLLQSLTLQEEDIADYKNRQIDYIGIKEKPIFKFEDTYHVINWNYLYNTLFNGLVFSFYKNSNCIKIFKSFDNYRSFLSSNFSHKLLFEGILGGCFHDSDCIWFDNNSDNFNPDCYIRQGKSIFIIEFKDNLINKHTIHSNDFNVIKKDLDRKFIISNNKKKGILQIKKNLEFLSKSPPEFDSIFKKEKIRNFKVYSIIIHNNFYFSLPGINEYLNEKFVIETANIKNAYKPLKHLTIIDIDFFIKHILHFKTHKISLDRILDLYSNEIKHSKAKHSDSQSLFRSMSSFDEIMNKKARKFPEVDNSNYLSYLYECLQIKVPSNKEND